MKLGTVITIAKEVNNAIFKYDIDDKYKLLSGNNTKDYEWRIVISKLRLVDGSPIVCIYCKLWIRDGFEFDTNEYPYKRFVEKYPSNIDTNSIEIAKQVFIDMISNKEIELNSSFRL